MRISPVMMFLLFAWPLLPSVPGFYADEIQFLKDVDEGQMDPQLDLHRLQYAPDPRWTLDWMSQRGHRSGLYGAWGSVTSRRLYTDMGIAFNQELSPALAFRYDQRVYADGGFDLRQERLALWWQARANLGFAVEGWPTPLKEQGSAGLGVRLGGPDSSLEVHLVDDGFFWNQKHDGGLRFDRNPLRLMIDGHGLTGNFLLAGSLDLGSRYRMVDTGRSLEGAQRFGTLLAEYRTAGRALGGSITAGSRWLEQSEGVSGRFHLDRSFLRITTHGRWESDGPTWYGQVAAVRQRDSFGAPRNGTGTYRMEALVLAVEAGWRTMDALELRPGYMASPYRMERGVNAPLPEAHLQPEDSSGYTDKVHLRALWTFKPGISLEFLLSHTLSGSSFGGAAVKGRFLF